MTLQRHIVGHRTLAGLFNIILTLVGFIVTSQAIAAQPALTFYGSQCGTCSAALQPDGSYFLNCANSAGVNVKNTVKAKAAISAVEVNGTAITCTATTAPTTFPCGTIPANAASQSWVTAANSNGILSAASCNLPLTAVVQAQLDSGMTPFAILTQNPSATLALLGASYLGGIIINIDSSGRGLLAAPVDVSGQLFATSYTTAYWTNYGMPGGYVQTKATNTGLYQGAGNTQAIIAAQKAPANQSSGAFNYVAYAAQVANQQSYLGFSDWYVPTVNEMQAAITYAVGLNSAVCNSPTSVYTSYWTSSETSRAYATSVNCTSNASQSVTKNNTYRVRLVRQFTNTNLAATTTAATSISNQVTFNGTVSAGTSTISSIGICYNTVKLSGPTDYCIPMAGSTSGAITITLPLAQFLPGTSYNFRAYAATTTNGTTYGNTVTWTNPGTAPAARSGRERMLNGESPFIVYQSDPSTLPNLLGGTWLDSVLLALDIPGNRGLLAAPGNEAGSYTWMNNPPGYVVTGATDQTLYLGDSNTQKINTTQGSPGGPMFYAGWRAWAANRAGTAGYLNFGYWYLPDAAEAQAMVANGFGNGGAACVGGNYWTSSEISSNQAIYISCLDGTLDGWSQNALKNNPYSVRLVRKFTRSTPQLLTQPAVLAGGIIQMKANVSNLNGAVISSTGFCYGTTQYPALPSGNCVPGTLSGANISGSASYSAMPDDTLYFVRAYAVTDNGNVYGNPVRITTPAAGTCNAGITNTFSIQTPWVLATNAAANRIYVSSSNNGAFSLQLIDGNSKRVITSITTDTAGVSLVVDDARGIAYYTTGVNGYVYAIDAVTGAAITSVQLPGLANSNTLTLALNGSTGALYIGDRTSSKVFQLTSRTLALAGSASLNANIKSMVYSTTSSKLFVAHMQAFPKPAPTFMSVLDANLATPAQVSGVNHVEDMIIDPTTNLIFVSTGTQISIISPVSNTVVGAVGVGLISRQVRYNPTNHQAYVGIDGSASAWIVNVDTATPNSSRVIGEVSVGNGSKRLAVASRTNTIYATAANDKLFTALNGSTNKAMSSLTFTVTPNTLQLNTKTGLLYVGSTTGNVVYEVACE